MSKDRRSTNKVVVAAFLATTLMALSSPVQAVNREGAKCTKAGSTVTVAGKKLVCKKRGRALKWVAVARAAPSESDVTWSQTNDGWKPSAQPPACPDPLRILLPVDLTMVTSILYPGQSRGGDYKPHGGFAFDNNLDQAVDVVAPFTGMAMRGSRYVESGEIQYTFDVISTCGIMYRLDHLLTLTAKFQALANTLPPAGESSASTNFNPPFLIKEGEKLAVGVGVTKPTRNVFVDFGVYDMRKFNTISSNPNWIAQHPGNKEMSAHAICWFDLLDAQSATTVRSLPSRDGTNGKSSDYCN